MSASGDFWDGLTEDEKVTVVVGNKLIEAIAGDKEFNVASKWIAQQEFGHEVTFIEEYLKVMRGKDLSGIPEAEQQVYLSSLLLRVLYAFGDIKSAIVEGAGALEEESD